MFVKSDHIRTTRPSKKLSEKFLGPFTIIAQAGAHSFTLHLPESMHSIHPVFHVSMIEPATPNSFPGRNSVPNPPVIIDGEPEYEISLILDSKIDKRCKCKLQYLVQWTGYEGTDEETLGYQHLNSLTLLNLSPTSTKPIPTNPGHGPPPSSIYPELHTFSTCNLGPCPL